MKRNIRGFACWISRLSVIEPPRRLTLESVTEAYEVLKLAVADDRFLKVWAESCHNNDPCPPERSVNFWKFCLRTAFKNDAPPPPPPADGTG